MVFREHSQIFRRLNIRGHFSGHHTRTFPPPLARVCSGAVSIPHPTARISIAYFDINTCRSEYLLGVEALYTYNHSSFFFIVTFMVILLLYCFRYTYCLFSSDTCRGVSFKENLLFTITRVQLIYTNMQNSQKFTSAFFDLSFTPDIFHSLYTSCCVL